MITKKILLRMSQAAYQRQGVCIPFDRASLKCIVRCRKGEGEGGRGEAWKRWGGRERGEGGREGKGGEGKRRGRGRVEKEREGRWKVREMENATHVCWS